MSNIKMSNIKYDKFENSLKAQGKAGFHIFKCTFVHFRLYVMKLRKTRTNWITIVQISQNGHC